MLYRALGLAVVVTAALLASGCAASRSPSHLQNLAYVAEPDRIQERQNILDFFADRDFLTRAKLVSVAKVDWIVSAGRPTRCWQIIVSPSNSPTPTGPEHNVAVYDSRRPDVLPGETVVAFGKHLNTSGLLWGNVYPIEKSRNGIEYVVVASIKIPYADLAQP